MDYADLPRDLIEAAVKVAKRMECGSCGLVGGPGEQRYCLCCDPFYLGGEAFTVEECECIAEARAGRFGVLPSDTATEPVAREDGDAG